MCVIAGWGEPANPSTTAAEDPGRDEPARDTAGAGVTLPASTTTACTVAITASRRLIEYSLFTVEATTSTWARR
jgi:hypothetical protein